MKRAVQLLMMIYIGGILYSCKNNNAKDPDVSSNKKTISNRPNIIFIMDDQHRWDALGKINSQVITPTLDSLATHGIYFSQAVCQAPMCVPSRNSIMFGLYPNQTSVFRNNGGVPDSLMPGKTMAQYFKDAGYETAGFGKTHWGKYKTNTRGFETRYVSEIPEEGAISMAEMNPDAKARYDAEIAPMGAGEENNLGYLGFTSKLPEEDHRDGWITKQAIDYIKKRKDDRPLFFYLSYMKPHAGHNVPEGYEDLYAADNIQYAQQPPWIADYSPHSEGVNRRDMYEDYWKNASKEEWKQMTMRYYANVTWIDNMMGRTLKALKNKGILDNALIIYTSDHGEMLGEHYYRFNKYNLYEASVRVPMILSGSALPNTIKKNTVSNQPVENIDILPTLLNAANIDSDNELPGKNLLGPVDRTGSFSSLHERDGEAAFMWRTQEYKLILVFERQKMVKDYKEEHLLTGEFYNLIKDPNEWDNLYGNVSVQDVQDKLTKALIAHLKQQ
ncbi:sulfatase [Maribacter sp. MAR_2009_72]|uniref:sulfatase family protein n=1 Tax=Maribacter sp. MAR_2009_72 TaxID=1250050 RepID=UPI0011993FB5|nr:sulfatase-like hydrolase/transferase [Maribacter sp. MAR_2009_72]TVZ14944.1 arylsulfatase A-like enzyme [Maribacter sp. MAR_2009_72]